MGEDSRPPDWISALPKQNRFSHACSTDWREAPQVFQHCPCTSTLKVIVSHRQDLRSLEAQTSLATCWKDMDIHHMRYRVTGHKPDFLYWKNNGLWSRGKCYLHCAKAPCEKMGFLLTGSAAWGTRCEIYFQNCYWSAERCWAKTSLGIRCLPFPVSACQLYFSQKLSCITAPVWMAHSGTVTQVPTPQGMQKSLRFPPHFKASCQRTQPFPAALTP